MRSYKTERGFCPEQIQQFFITVEFAEVSIMGIHSPQYRKMGFSCDYYAFHECNSCGEDGSECPLYKQSAM